MPAFDSTNATLSFPAFDSNFAFGPGNSGNAVSSRQSDVTLRYTIVVK